jgi:hypothetical protein
MSVGASSQLAKDAFCAGCGSKFLTNENFKNKKVYRDLTTGNRFHPTSFRSSDSSTVSCSIYSPYSSLLQKTLTI